MLQGAAATQPYRPGGPWHRYRYTAFVSCVQAGMACPQGAVGGNQLADREQFEGRVGVGCIYRYAVPAGCRGWWALVRVGLHGRWCVLLCHRAHAADRLQIDLSRE